jgi:hypothetical protein
MYLMAAIATWSVLAFAAVLFILQVLARETGYWLGRRSAVRRQGEVEGVSFMVSALLALLAFILALTLSFSNARFDERRLGALAEANAIGTAWLRAEALGNPQGAEIARLLIEYAKLRERYVTAGPDPAVIAAIDAQTSALQGEIWDQATVLIRARPDALIGLLTAALNEVFDMTTAERFAFALNVPPQITWLLFAMALIGMGSVGYRLGLRGKPLRLVATLLTLTWTAVIVDILDFGTPRIGNFRTDSAVYEWTLSSMTATTSVPNTPPR